MGNEMSEQREHKSVRLGSRWSSSDEEYDRRQRRNSSTIRKRERRSGNRSSRREKPRVKELDDEFQICNKITDFGFERAHSRIGFGFDDMKQMICQASSSRHRNGAYHSTEVFSSITTVGADGVPVSESRGISSNSNGRCKMAHQRRIGERSQTLVRQRPNQLEEFKESQFLRQMSHDDLPQFRSEFNHRTKKWRSYRAVKRAEKPPRAFEDGRHPRPVQSFSHSRPVSSQNYRRPSESYEYRPRGIEY